MSNTYKHKYKALAKIAHNKWMNDYTIPWYEYSGGSWYRSGSYKYIPHWKTMCTPMWWNHIYNIKPYRAKNKQLLHRLQQLPDLAYCIQFYNYKKPHFWYY